MYSDIVIAQTQLTDLMCFKGIPFHPKIVAQSQPVPAVVGPCSPHPEAALARRCLPPNACLHASGTVAVVQSESPVAHVHMNVVGRARPRPSLRPPTDGQSLNSIRIGRSACGHSGRVYRVERGTAEAEVWRGTPSPLQRCMHYLK